MTPDALVAELERLHEAATPGPWFIVDNEHYLEIKVNEEPYSPGELGNVCASKFLDGQKNNPVAKDNAALIAFMRTNLPAILSALRSQQEEIARLTARADYLQEKVDIDSKFIHETVIELDKAKTDLATARRDALTEAAALMRGNRYLSGGPGPLFAAGWNAACNNSAGLVEKLRDDPPGQANGAEGKV